MLMHGLDDLGCRDRPCARETLQKRCQAKEMIAVPMGDVNGGEVLAARDDPIQQSLRLLRGEKGVHENGVALTDNGPVAALEQPSPLLGLQRLSTTFNTVQHPSTPEILA